MSFNFNNCKNCQQKYNELKNWEVKKKVALENGNYHTEICRASSYSRNEIAKYCPKCKNTINMLSNEYGESDPNWEHDEEEYKSLQKDNHSPTSRDDKKILELEINQLKITVEQFRALKKQGTPGYSEYTHQELEKQLTEKRAEYKSKFGELPNSIKDDDNSNGERERERERDNFKISLSYHHHSTFWLLN